MRPMYAFRFMALLASCGRWANRLRSNDVMRRRSKVQARRRASCTSALGRARRPSGPGRVNSAAAVSRQSLPSAPRTSWATKSSIERRRAGSCARLEVEPVGGPDEVEGRERRVRSRWPALRCEAACSCRTTDAANRSRGSRRRAVSSPGRSRQAARLRARLRVLRVGRVVDQQDDAQVRVLLERGRQQRRADDVRVLAVRGDQHRHRRAILREVRVDLGARHPMVGRESGTTTPAGP